MPLLWRRVRRWFRPPRRLRVLRPGGFLIIGTLALGLATLNTGNNLLYLLLGALLGTIALSGWLSEQALRGLRITRVLPRAVTAGQPARITYQVENRKRRLPSHGLVVREIVAVRGLVGEPAFVAALEPGAAARVRGTLTAARRGVYPLEGVVLATSFPFGLFSKERDIVMPGALVVWPRTDRAVRAPRLGGRRSARQYYGAGVAAGAERGDYRGLREYRAGDDPRDIHWRSSARRSEPVVREYDRDAADEYWIVLDRNAPDEESGEAAVETAASLLAAAARRGERVGLAAGNAAVPPAAVSTSLDAALDILAGVVLAVTRDREADAPAALPAPRDQCVLVTARPGAGDGWGAVIVASVAEP